MGKGECTRRVNPLYAVEGSEKSQPYRHAGCCVALDDTAAFFHVVLGLQLRTRERPGRLREGTRKRHSSREVASWLSSLMERKMKCGSGGRVASFQVPWLRRSPRGVDGASCPVSGLEKPQIDAQDGSFPRNSFGKPLPVSVLLPRHHEPCS
jgi:hypothetical protein